jgi:hypothetical protein
MKCIAVTTTNPSERLSGADLVLNSLEELDEGALKSILP